MTPVISVIVANYNSERHLAAALRSILSQSFTALEVLLVDDMSTDLSLAIADSFAADDPRLRILRLPQNRGPAAARNAGLRAAHGAWIAIIDADDFIHLDRLRRLWEAAELDQADIIADDQLIFDDAGQAGAKRLLHGARAARPSWISASDYINANRLFAKPASLGYLKPLIRASLLRRHGIDYNEDLKNAEDYDLILRLLIHGARFRLLPEILYFYRRHHLSISHRLTIDGLRAMESADDGFRQWAGPQAIAPLRAALDARRASIATAAAVETAIALLKARKPMQTLVTLATQPAAIPILARLFSPRALLARRRRGGTPAAGLEVTPCGIGAVPPMPPAALPFVTIVVPALNEARYIESCLSSLVAQCAAGRHEILVMDGGSRDATRAIVSAFCEHHASVILYDNPKRLQSAALNLGARLAAAHSTIMIRADAHAHYAQDFVSSCVSAMVQTGATSVVVPMRTQALPGAFLQRAIAAAQSSRLGNGGAAHRANPVSGFVEHGHHAAFNLPFFRALGGYDESFTHNEDAELDVRARKAGGGVWMCAEQAVLYYPRDRLNRLALQYYRHGSGRARTLRKHKLTPKLRQVVPLGALAGCVAGVAAAPFVPADASLALAYPAICLTWGISEAIKRRDPSLVFAGLALMTMHLSWAAGFVGGTLRAWSLPQSHTPIVQFLQASQARRADATREAERR